MMNSLRILLLFTAILFIPMTSYAQWPNEPSGSITLFDCRFDTPTCEGRLLDGYNTVGNGTLSVQQDGTAPLSPANVMRSTMNYQSRNGGTQLERRDPADLTEVFVGLWWRSNPEFNGSSVGANKMFFIRGGPSQNGVFVWAIRPGVSRLYWTTQLPYNLNQCGGTDLDQCYGNTGNYVDFVPGTWYRIEVYMKASTCPTCRDGIARWWITQKGGSPVLVGNYVNFAYGPLLNEWVWSETWDGGGSGTGFTSNPSHFIDHLHISAPNCPSGCSAGGGTNPFPGAPSAPVLESVTPQ